MLPRALSVIFLCILAAGCDGSAKAATQPQDSKGAQGAPASRPEPVLEGTGSWQEEVKNASNKGIRFLRENMTKDGKWTFNKSSPPHIGITALCLLAMLESPRKYRETDGPFIRDGIEWIVSAQKEGGAIHTGELATYCTSTSVLALAATQNPKYRPVIAKAVDYLRMIQYDEGENYTPKDRYYGGISYGDSERADLSNTQFGLEALVAGEVSTEDPAFKRALIFLSRCQNSSETNDLLEGEVVPGTDGGGYYSPGVNPREWKAGSIKLADGKIVRRSYGSMSYALLKSYLFCKLDPKDARVRALVEWLNKSYTVEYNPGMDAADEKPSSRYRGLFYYYLSMARGLSAYKGDLLKDASGKPRNWREDLARAIIKLQQPDGAWVNDRSDDFWEASPNLATALALNALNACLR